MSVSGSLAREFFVAVSPGPFIDAGRGRTFAAVDVPDITPGVIRRFPCSSQNGDPGPAGESLTS